MSGWIDNTGAVPAGFSCTLRVYLMAHAPAMPSSYADGLPKQSDGPEYDKWLVRRRVSWAAAWADSVLAVQP